MPAPTYRRIKGAPLTNDEVDDNFLNMYTDKAPIASPSFTGVPLAPLAAVDTATGQIASTLYVINQGYAKIAAPTFTGIPKADTAAADTNTTQLATTQFVIGQAGTATPLMNSTAAVGASLRYARQDHVHGSDTTKANLASPTFTGIPRADTAAVDTSTTQLATTQFVMLQGYAKLASPTFSGTPTLSASPATADNTTAIATTAFVKNQNYAPKASPTFTGTVTAPTFVGNVTGDVTGNASNVTGVVSIANGGTGASTAAAALVALGAQANLGFEPYNSTNPSAYLSSGTGLFAPGQLCEVGRYIDFHTTTNGLDYDVRLDGQGSGTNGAGKLVVTASAGLECNGDVIAYSDERLKTNWRDLDVTLVDGVANLKHGVYDRIDTGATQVGVSAQSLQQILPEAVHTGEDGILSVAYGNAAMAICIQLAQRVVALEKKLADLGVN